MNAVSTHPRKYQLKARAERQRQTRERIVAATAALHEEVGPARTTIADIARRAGVQRLTVYNTFPEMRDLFGACQGHFLTANPPPDLAPRRGGANALNQFEATLVDLYRWYRANEAMQRHVQHDRHLIPDLDLLLRGSMDARFEAAAAAHARLLAGRATSAVAVRSLIRLAFDFRTWDLMAGRMSDGVTAKLMRRAVAGAASQAAQRR